MTAPRNHESVPRTRITVLAGAVAALALAASAPAKDPPLPPGWSHAEVNVVIKHRAHTVIYDRGRVTSLTPSSLTLHERDGSVVTIQVAPAATVKVNGRFASLADIRPGATAQTRRVDGGPAVLVQATQPKKARVAERAASGRANATSRGKSR
jgi:hypothetical protein